MFKFFIGLHLDSCTIKFPYTIQALKLPLIATLRLLRLSLHDDVEFQKRTNVIISVFIFVPYQFYNKWHAVKWRRTFLKKKNCRKGNSSYITTMAWNLGVSIVTSYNGTAIIVCKFAVKRNFHYRWRAIRGKKLRCFRLALRSTQLRDLKRQQYLRTAVSASFVGASTVWSRSYDEESWSF